MTRKMTSQFKASVALGTAAMLVGLAACATAEELPLSRIVLSSAGLAQFTHSGSITGGSTIDLSVRLQQVDDILKSLTVLDKEGAVGAVTLPGKAPLAELFHDLPFGSDALNSPWIDPGAATPARVLTAPGTAAIDSCDRKALHQ